MTQALPVLYSFRRCPYAMRARLAIAASGERVILREVVLSQKPQALIDASPKATVPVLVASDGSVMEESLDIMRWALQRNDPNRWLVPSSGDIEEMFALIAINDDEFKHHLDRYKYPQRYANADPASHRDEAAKFLLQLESRLTTNAWLFGEHATLADYAIAPFVRQYAATDPAWFGQQPWAKLQRWLKTIIDNPLFERIMYRYPKWEEGATAGVFPP